MTASYSSPDPGHYCKPDQKTLRDRLSDIQYRVTQEDATERPFGNEYNDEKREGIYVDIVSGEPLFSSTDKFDSGTGWPSFTRPISSGLRGSRKLLTTKLFMRRTEVQTACRTPTLGHVFTGWAGCADRNCAIAMNFSSHEFYSTKEVQGSGKNPWKPKAIISSLLSNEEFK